MIQFVAFERGRGGPKGEKISPARLCDRWNRELLEAGLGLTCRSVFRKTGNYVITSPEDLSVPELTRILDRLSTSRGFVVFTASDFVDWLGQLERHFAVAARPGVAANRQPNFGAVMDSDPFGGVAPELPSPDPARHPIQNRDAWMSSEFAVTRVRGVWKNDLLGNDRLALDPKPARRDGTWGAAARAMERAHGGKWTARSISTLRGVARHFAASVPEQRPRRGSKLARLVRENRDTILSIAARHGASNVRVFGSVARGESTPASDLDLLVDAGGETSPFFPGGLIDELEAQLGCKVDVLTEPALHWYVRDRILSEAVPL